MLHIVIKKKTQVDLLKFYIHLCITSVETKAIIGLKIYTFPESKYEG